jgi:plastocyanin
MNHWRPVLCLVIAVLTCSLIAGCSSPGGGYGSAPAPASQTVTINLSAEKMTFDQSTITVTAGVPVVVNFHNRESAGSSQVTGIAHNFALYDSPAAKTTIFSGEIITGGEDATYRFTAPAVPGTYFFRCDVHPAIMNGTFIVR